MAFEEGLTDTIPPVMEEVGLGQEAREGKKLSP
jgi:hypothetical protein